MPFEPPGPTCRRIAVIGGGISGMAAAHLLFREHAVVLFEANGKKLHELRRHRAAQRL